MNQLTRVLLVHGSMPPPPALLQALNLTEVSVSSVDAATAQQPNWRLLGPRPDLLLVDASMQPSQVARLARQVWTVELGGSIIVFALAVDAALNAHLVTGTNCLLPPFEPRRVAQRLLGLSPQTTDDHLARASYERELDTGREIQLGFLPQEVPRREGWDIGVRYLPARNVGGDFYDAFDLIEGRRLALVMADVCDKGVGAALFMALIRSLIRHSAEQSGARSTVFDALDPEHGPADAALIPMVGTVPLTSAIATTNDYLVRNHGQQAYFATIFFGVLDPISGRLIYINGGHNPPVLLRVDPATGQRHCELLHPTGPAIGIGAADFGVMTTTMALGDTLLIYTDGVTEARGPTGAQFGDDALLEMLEQSDAQGEALLSELHTLIRAHTGSAPQSDDVTMMVVHRQDDRIAEQVGTSRSVAW